MPALLIRMSTLSVCLAISAAAVRIDARSSREIEMKIVLVLGLMDAIWSITGWTFEAVRASRKICDGEPRERSMAV